MSPSTKALAARRGIYAASLSLNNIGISLLQHGSYDEAIESFAHSLRAMQEMCSASNSEQLPSNLDAIYEKLNIASHHLARCVTNGSTDCMQSKDEKISVISQEESLATILSILSQERKSDPPRYALIRIEVSHAFAPDYYAGVESAIILHNYGSVIMFLAEIGAPMRPDLGTINARNALRLLQLAASILDFGNFGSEASESAIIEPLHLSILVRRMLTLLASILGLESERNEHIIRMAYLCEVFVQEIGFLDGLSDRLAASAA